jgi:hypothetical protein
MNYPIVLLVLPFTEVHIVLRGSYSANVCIMPASGNFKGDSTYTIDGSTFKTYPTTLKAV